MSTSELSQCNNINNTHNINDKKKETLQNKNKKIEYRKNHGNKDKRIN